MSPGPHILIAEDDANDVLFLARAFARVGLSVPLEFAPDGDAAIDYLEHLDATPAAERPKALVLNLKLPRRSGLEVLRWVRAHERHRDLPVIILTSSSQRQDVEAAESLGVDGYFVKPVDFLDLTEVVRAIARIWHLGGPGTA